MGPPRPTYPERGPETPHPSSSHPSSPLVSHPLRQTMAMAAETPRGNEGPPCGPSSSKARNHTTLPHPTACWLPLHTQMPRRTDPGTSHLSLRQRQRIQTAVREPHRDAPTTRYAHPTPVAHGNVSGTGQVHCVLCVPGGRGLPIPSPD